MFAFYFNLAKDLTSDFMQLWVARGFSVISFYYSMTRYSQPSALTIEVAARYNFNTWMANDLRFLLSPIVNESADAALLSDPHESQQQLKHLYRKTWTSGILPAVGVITITEGYALLLPYLRTSQAASDELKWLPLFYFYHQLLLMLMTAQTNFIIGSNFKNSRRALLIIFFIGALIMGSMMELLLHFWKTTIDALILANFIQLTCFCIMYNVYLALPANRYLLQGIKEWSLWSQALTLKPIYKKGLQPLFIYLGRVISHAVVLFILTGDALPAFQTLFPLISIFDSIAAFFEQRTVVHVKSVKKELANQSEKLRAALRFIFVFQIALMSFVPAVLLIVAACYPKLFDFFISDTPNNQPIRAIALHPAKWAFPSLMGIFYSITAISRGTIFSSKESPDQYLKTLNDRSTYVCLGCSFLYIAMTYPLTLVMEDTVLAAWIALLTSQGLAMLVHLGLTHQFIQYECLPKTQEIQLALLQPEQSEQPTEEPVSEIDDTVRQLTI